MGSSKGDRNNSQWRFLVSKPSPIIKKLIPEETKDHPLKSYGIPVDKKGTSSEDASFNRNKISDPLSISIEDSDPLSLMAAEMDWDLLDSQTPVKEQISEFCLKPWVEQRAVILNKFTTSQKLSMTTSFLHCPEKVNKVHHNPVVQHRLEQLDDFEEGSIREVGQLTQQQYSESINQLNEELVQAWNQDHRVKALKIAIQCSKLLVDTSVIQFYPSKFVLITDVLDKFGSLVYERLKSKANANQGANGRSAGGPLPDNFTSDMVSEMAKETCRNWFYKIASIRELVPRLYVEAAILKSYSFLTNKEFSQALNRLTHMVRGIGDPLVSVYARCYLCRVGMSVATIDRQFLKENFFDFLDIYHLIFDRFHVYSIQNEISKQKIDMTCYLSTFEPALEWILQGLSNAAPPELLDEIIDRCSTKRIKINKNGLLLKSIMTTFKPNFIASRADLFVNLISASSNDDIPQVILILALGKCLQNHLVENPTNVFENIWKLIKKQSNPAYFINCAQTWTLFLVKNFTHDRINTFLGDILKHVGNENRNCGINLQNIVTTIVANVNNVESIFLMDKLLPVLDLLEADSNKVAVCRKILEIFTSKQGVKCTDPISIVGLIFIAKILHDSINALTVEDEKKQIGNMISKLIRQINCGMDFEKQLNFYVEARGTFTNIDSVLSTLVHCVNNLAMETGRIVKSHHTRKTASFVRACAAYCYITIPSITSEITRLQLYLLSAQVALFNQCLGQADACIKAALTLCLELPSSIESGCEIKSTEPFLSEYISNLLSTLLVVPDCPDQGAVYLARGLVNMLNHYTNQQNAGVIASLFLKVIDMLAASSQPKYLYHIKNVDSNDVLYGSDPKFLSEINKMSSIVCDEILNYLKVLGSNNNYNKQAKLAFELFVRMVYHSDLQNPEMASLALNLWKLSMQHKSLDQKFITSTLRYLKFNFSSSAHNELFSKLV